MINRLSLNFKENKIENMENFSLSFKEFHRLEYLKLSVNNNLPAFFIKNNKSSNVMNKMILKFNNNKIELIEDFALSLKEFNRL